MYYSSIHTWWLLCMECLTFSQCPEACSESSIYSTQLMRYNQGHCYYITQFQTVKLTLIPLKHKLSNFVSVHKIKYP